MVTKYQNEEITKPVQIPIDDVIIGTFTEDYKLSVVEFERIKTGQPKTLGFALTLLGITIGFGVNLIAEVIDQESWSGASSGEWKTLAGLSAATASLLILGLFLPNKRKTTLKIIEDHFGSAETRKQAVKRGKT